MNKQMNEAQVASFIKTINMKIDSWKEEYQQASSKGSTEYSKSIDLRIKIFEEVLEDFMDTLDND